MNDRPARLLGAVALAAACAAPGGASASEQLFQKHACAACHVVDRKNVGPLAERDRQEVQGQGKRGRYPGREDPEG